MGINVSIFHFQNKCWGWEDLISTGYTQLHNKVQSNRRIMGSICTSMSSTATTSTVENLERESLATPEQRELSKKQALVLKPMRGARLASARIRRGDISEWYSFESKVLGRVVPSYWRFRDPSIVSCITFTFATSCWAHVSPFISLHRNWFFWTSASGSW